MARCFDSHVSMYRAWLTENTPRAMVFNRTPAWGPWRRLVDARIVNG